MAWSQPVGGKVPLQLRGVELAEPLARRSGLHPRGWSHLQAEEVVVQQQVSRSLHRNVDAIATLASKMPQLIQQ
jgi:hypothetical protein